VNLAYRLLGQKWGVRKATFEKFYEIVEPMLPKMFWAMTLERRWLHSCGRLDVMDHRLRNHFGPL